MTGRDKRPKQYPDLHFEQAIRQASGAEFIVGIDEAGRGAWAGPVVAAAVILPLSDPNCLQRFHGVNDSKQLTPAQRQQLYDLIATNALAWAVSAVPAAEIDKIGIVPANFKAMKNALNALDPAGEYLLLDGRFPLPNSNLPQKWLIKGDTLSLSIAAASILAKVSRDRYMIQMSEQYPAYHFAQHKGYGTLAHHNALREFGPCPLHRQTFLPKPNN